MGGRRKRRGVMDHINMSTIILEGLEEFEEKIDKSLADSDMDGIEPPMLDETWGLGIRNASSFKSASANTTISEPVKLEESRKKREAQEEDTEDNLDEDDENLDVE